MRQASKRVPDSAEKTVRDIRRATRRHHSAEESARAEHASPAPGREFFRRRRLEAVTRGAEPNAVLSVGTTARLTQPLANFSAPRQAGLFFEARFRASRRMANPVQHFDARQRQKKAPV